MDFGKKVGVIMVIWVNFLEFIIGFPSFFSIFSFRFAFFEDFEEGEVRATPCQIHTTSTSIVSIQRFCI